MNRSRFDCPRLCILISCAVVLGLLPFAFLSIATSRFHGWQKIIPIQPQTFVQRVSKWHISLPKYMPPIKPVTLLFVGDIMLDRTVATRIKKAKDPGYPFRRLPPGWFDEVDYAIANLEGPLTAIRRPPEKSIDFQFDPSATSTLKELGIDAVSQANNHALDQGRLGYEDSVKNLRDAGFLVFGDQVSDDEVALATTTIRGKRFAFLGFNTTDNPLDLDAASSTLATARANADHVLVFMHWGLEYRHDPPASVTSTAAWLIDHGADVVIGGHPHWVQGLATHQGKPIAYSLGNFVFDQDFSLETRQGLALKLTFYQNRLTLEPIPIQIDKSQPFIVEGEDKDQRLQDLAKISDEDLQEQIKEGRIEFENRK